MGEMEKVIASLRREYAGEALDISHVDKSPFVQFQYWFEEAVRANVNEANAMSLATVGKAGRPSIRVVLLKRFDESGFVFFTNYESRKGRDLAENPFASMSFFWPELFRQVRIEGRVEKVLLEESDSYFESRPFDSRIGAVVSKQSQVLESREYLEAQVNSLSSEYEGKNLKRPAFWGGFCLIPEYFEFWQGRPNRLHDRIIYDQNADNWDIKRLFP